MKIGENEVLKDLGTMTDGAEYHLYFVKSPMRVKKVTYVCDGEEHCLPDVDLISVESVRTTFPDPSEATKAEAVLKETFRQFLGGSNGLSTNVPCCAAQYPSDVDVVRVRPEKAGDPLKDKMTEADRRMYSAKARHHLKLQASRKAAGDARKTAYNIDGAS